jgi:ABC-type cobalt transport system substrate-binding protein
VRRPLRRGIPLLLPLFFLIAAASLWAEDKPGKWPGVDEAVVEKFAKTQGRVARAPLLDTEQGDLPLFLFLLAGAVGGFVAGYYWRLLVSEKNSKFKKEPQRST